MKPMNAFIVLFAAVVFLSSGSAIAADRKIYNGSMCQPEVAENRLGTSTAGATNGNTNLILVACPIVRDNTGNTNGTSAAFVTVRSSGGQSLSCSLASRDRNGNLIEAPSASTTSSTPITLNVDVNASAALGSYALACVLPPGGQIISYDIDEF